MADYPSGIFDPRTKENADGVEYDAEETTIVFAEDVNESDAEIVAIQTELGTDPAGAYETVKAWLTALTSLLSTHASRHENGGDDEISVANLSGELADNQPPKAHASDHAAGESDEITDADIEARFAVTFIVDGGGSAITTGEKGHFVIPYKSEITKVTLLGDQSGSIKVDLWLDTYANFPPTNADTITGANEPEISSGVKDQDGTLTDWTKTVAAGSVVAVNIDSAATIERLTIILELKRVV